MKAYIVKTGDSLSKIARDVLGDMSLWPALANLNSIPAPYTIFPGRTIDIDVPQTMKLNSGPVSTSSSAQPAQPNTSPATQAQQERPNNNNKYWIIGGALLILVIVIIAIKTHQSWLKK